MTDFNRTLLAQSPLGKIESHCLGTGGADLYDSAKDLGKPVKMGVAQNYVLCADGDDIEGVVSSVEPSTYNSGYSFGGVQRDGRIEAYVAAAEVGTFAEGDEAIAGIQIAIGTAGIAQVKKGAGSVFKWRCIRVITGTGVAGDKILLERI